MDFGTVLFFLARTAAGLVCVLALAFAGRWVAARLRQPEVVGEITGGLLAGPVIVGLFGAPALAAALPADVLAALKMIGEAGLALYLVGLTHELRAVGPPLPRRLLTRVVLGALVPPMCAGAALAGWTMSTADPVVRGTAPTPAFLLFTALALAVTAVPVLARIMADRGLTDTIEGRLAMTGAIVLDVVSWVLLTVVVALDAGSSAGLLRVLLTMAGAVVVVLLVRRLLDTGAIHAVVSRTPRCAAVVVAVAAVALALGVERLGMSMIFGAVLAGLAIRVGDPAWKAVVIRVTAVGRVLIPAFFVVTGVTVLTAGFAGAPWSLIIITTTLGLLGKVGGGYAGARFAGQPRAVSIRLGVLFNTRGLTELVFLQVGYSSGILTPPLYLALVVMALVTTAMTGPLLATVDRVCGPARTAVRSTV